jgi:hypothetical protein
MAGTCADVRRPWPGKWIAASTKVELCGGRGRREVEGEMVVEEGVIGFLIRSPFKGGISKERITAQGDSP